MNRITSIVVAVLAATAAQAQMPPSQGAQTPYIQAPGAQPSTLQPQTTQPQFGSAPPQITPPQINTQPGGAPFAGGTVAPLPQTPALAK